MGDELMLVRESDNPHDSNAVAVYHGQTQLGYVPRGENSAIAQMLDRGETLSARICRLTDDENPWERVRVTIELA